MSECTVYKLYQYCLHYIATGAVRASDVEDKAIDYEQQLLHFADIDGQPEALDNVEAFSRLVNAFRDLAPDNTLVVSSGDDYIPSLRLFAAGEPVLLVNVDGDYRYLGRRHVGFSPDGLIISETLDSDVNGTYATHEDAMPEVDAQSNQRISRIVEGLREVLQRRKKKHTWLLPRCISTDVAAK